MERELREEKWSGNCERRSGAGIARGEVERELREKWSGNCEKKNGAGIVRGKVERSAIVRLGRNNKNEVFPLLYRRYMKNGCFKDLYYLLSLAFTYNVELRFQH